MAMNPIYMCKRFTPAYDINMRFIYIYILHTIYTYITKYFMMVWNVMPMSETGL